MKYYNTDLELCVLSCIFIKPELTEKLIIDDKYFINQKRLWKFMKACYKKFGTYDINLMYSVCSNKYHLIEYITQLLDTTIDYWNFEKYQKRLIEKYNELQKEKIIKEKIFENANDLYIGNITIDEFIIKIDRLIKK